MRLVLLSNTTSLVDNKDVSSNITHIGIILLGIEISKQN